MTLSLLLPPKIGQFVEKKISLSDEKQAYSYRSCSLESSSSVVIFTATTSLVQNIIHTLSDWGLQLENIDILPFCATCIICQSISFSRCIINVLILSAKHDTLFGNPGHMHRERITTAFCDIMWIMWIIAGSGSLRAIVVGITVETES